MNNNQLFRQLAKDLDVLQAKTIGLFKVNHPNAPLELVVSNDNGYLTTFHIGSLGGTTINHIEATEGRVVMFCNGRSLIDMRDLHNYKELASLIELLNSNKPIPPPSQKLTHA